MNILVTGASGFLGLNLVRELLTRDYRVRAQTYSGRGNAHLEGLDLEIVKADITVPEDVREIVKGQNLVIHTAGDTSFWKKNFARQREINVTGCEILGRACVEAGVKRLVHISTVDVFGHNPNGSLDETWEDYSYKGWNYNYADTKREGEGRLREILKDKVELIIIYPGSLLGPLDTTLQYGRLFFDLRDGKVPGIPCGGSCFAHVGEVARMAAQALTEGDAGQGYICAGTPASYREFFEVIARKMQAKAPRWTLPRSLLVGYAYMEEFMANFTGKAPELNPGLARYMSINALYDSSKAIRELGFKNYSLAELVDAEYDWYAENDYF